MIPLNSMAGLTYQVASEVQSKIGGLIVDLQTAFLESINAQLANLPQVYEFKLWSE